MDLAYILGDLSKFIKWAFQMRKGVKNLKKNQKKPKKTKKTKNLIKNKIYKIYIK
jgi:hypothetical protein